MAASSNNCLPEKVEKRNLHSCCEKKQEKKSQKDNSCNRECPGVCNPFGQGTCCLYTASAISYQFNLIASLADFDALTSAHLLSTYQADCFHPPEVV